SDNGGWSGYLWARNVLDEQYFEQLLAAPAGNGAGHYGAVLGDPRVYGATLLEPRRPLDSLLQRVELVLLAADRCGVHETALGHRERLHAVHVPGGRARVRVAGARRCRRALRACRGLRAGRDGDGRCRSVELEFAAGELVVRGFVLEEDGLPVRLTSGLGPERNVREGGDARDLAALVDLALAPCA